jgi:hypothetical protein
MEHLAHVCILVVERFTRLDPLPSTLKRSQTGQVGRSVRGR